MLRDVDKMDGKMRRGIIDLIRENHNDMLQSVARSGRGAFPGRHLNGSGKNKKRGRVREESE